MAVRYSFCLSKIIAILPLIDAAFKPSSTGSKKTSSNNKYRGANAFGGASTSSTGRGSGEMPTWAIIVVGLLICFVVIWCCYKCYTSCDDKDENNDTNRDNNKNQDHNKISPYPTKEQLSTIQDSDFNYKNPSVKSAFTFTPTNPHPSVT